MGVTRVLVFGNGIENEYKEAWEDWEEGYGRLVEVNDLTLADWDLTVARYNDLQSTLEGILYS